MVNLLSFLQISGIGSRLISFSGCNIWAAAKANCPILAPTSTTVRGRTPMALNVRHICQSPWLNAGVRNFAANPPGRSKIWISRDSLTKRKFISFNLILSSLLSGHFFWPPQVYGLIPLAKTAFQCNFLYYAYWHCWTVVVECP